MVRPYTWVAVAGVDFTVTRGAILSKIVFITIGQIPSLDSFIRLSSPWPGNEARQIGPREKNERYRDDMSEASTAKRYGQRRIEDYGFIGDMNTAALVSRDGSIDWFCAPRFDSGACLAALLGTEQNGHWNISPKGKPLRTSRRYRDYTLVLETEHVLPEGIVRVIDFMPTRGTYPRIVRIVEGIQGRVPMAMQLVVRFEYGSRVPWVHRTPSGLEFAAGPNGLVLHFEVDIRAENFVHTADFEVEQGDRLSFELCWYPSHEPPPEEKSARDSLTQTEAWWREWSSSCCTAGEYRDPVLRSLVVLKALTYYPTGGIVAAPTTSLPEELGGVRNWDYRYCWLRDATFSLYSLMINGYAAEARAWRDWLLRAIAGQPELLQIMYGPAGEMRMPEFRLPHLRGSAGSKPVRVGNKAAEQFQLDVYGEVMDSMYIAGRTGVAPNPMSWSLQKVLMESLESRWEEPDDGIWEVRGPRRHFTHSKVMAWVAADRAVRSIERLNLDGPVDKWKRLREDIHREVCAKGYNARRGTFTWYYGSKSPDASLLMIPLVGFLPATDPRMTSTLEAILKELVTDGLVRRYDTTTEENVDGLRGGEGVFLPCTFWLADNLVLQNRTEEARALFERLLSLRNDLGLLSEEYDTTRKTLLGNFPQAFTHVSLTNTAQNLSSKAGPAHQRRSPQ
jgi:GH15 family glucan-1,4-alpha-glucosidase